MKRIFDLLVSLSLLIILLPIFIFISFWILLDDPGSVFYLQERIGYRQIPFRILKFRTMYRNADREGLLTVGGRDPRVTRSGYYLRKYKLDELPQLINVIKGEMSLVGPRPEVKKFVDLYNVEQLQVFQVKPGITDFASIEYANENELLSKSPDAEKTYIQEIMPAKLELNLKYVAEQGFGTDLKILFKTFSRVFLKNS
ncbi:MAG: putative colanic biosynthesis UDP-glucose lipid carrier transferase [Bacteroidota bacterium]